MIKIILFLIFACAGSSELLEQSYEREDSESCGIPSIAIGTIVRGKNFTRGNFPWIVALYQKIPRKLPAYFCAGTVISDHHVLTAAHCLEGLKPRDIIVLFGAHDLNNPYEVDRVAKSPSRLLVHDLWNPDTIQFDADIAILLMPEKIVFSSYVRPICLWRSEDELSASVGTIAAWGQSENRSIDHETIPKKLELPIHKNEDCFLAHFELGQYSSKNTFCAGLGDGRGPCSGDSGGGLFVLNENVYYLKGLVSSAIKNVYGECRLEKYTIYTDVLKFKSWIDDTMESSLGDVGAVVPRKPISKVQCGKPVQRSGLIVQGNSFNRGEMPWMVAVFLKKRKRFICGATLISNKHIISVADCYNSKGNSKTLAADKITIALGAFDLGKQIENDRVDQTPVKIMIHPDWNATAVTYDADLAMLVMAKKIQFSRFVIPICLWNSQNNPSTEEGVIAGWGYGQLDADTHENIPKKIKVPIHSNEECFLSNRQLVQISSRRTFCGGSADGTGPCSGDSGNGLVISHESSFYLRGLVSVSWANGDHCGLASYTVYTDILKYKSWIDDTMKNNMRDVDEVRCGKPVQRSGLIVHGNSFNRGEMPWLVAIHLRSGNKFFCGGTLISSKHILSVAHCYKFKGDSTTRRADEITVTFGAYDLGKKLETGTIYKSPEKIIIHPDWNAHTENFDADIAALVMAEEIQFSRFIIPICLWSSQKNLTAQEGTTKGTTAGWGYGQADAAAHEDIPKKIEVPIHSNEDCFLENLDLVQISSRRTFCGGSADGTGPCAGDSGNGLFVSYGDAFYLRGISSSGLVNDDGQCDLTTYNVYTDVLKFSSWIDSILKGKDGKKSEDSPPIWS